MADSAERDRSVALAGVYQAAVLARQLARRGHADAAPLRSSVRSVLIVDAINTVSVFGGVAGVQLGLAAIARQSGSAGDLEVARYVVALCQLARRFMGSSEATGRVSRELAGIQQDTDIPADAPPPTELYERLATVYRETLSPLKPQIMVQGEQANLANALVVAQIRASLLAGVRAGVLFAQLDGSRWQLLFQRRRYMRNAARLLAEIEPDAPSATLH